MGNCSSAPRLKVNLRAFIAANPPSDGSGDGWYFDTMNVLLDRWAYSHVQFLRKKFLEATGDKGEKELDKKGFFKLFAELQDMPKAVAESAFRMFDTDNSGKLNFREFCCALALCCHLMSSDDEKIRFVFDMFDTNDDGLLSPSDAQLLLEHALPRELDGLSKDDDKKPDDSSGGEAKDSSLAIRRQQRISEIKQDLLANSQNLTFERFYEWATRNLDHLNNLLQTFQLVPSPERERRICEEILSRHQTLQEGSTWYCISHKWLQVWKAHASWRGPNPGRRVHGSGSGPGLLGVSRDPSFAGGEEELALDEEPAFGEIGIGSASAAALGGLQHMSTRPPEIDNSDLEGEHKGELKMNLVEHLDYELIPEEMWLKLVEWYGGGPAILRKVICMGEDGQPQVELYPPLLLVVVAGESGQPMPQFSRRFFISRQSSLEEVLQMLADKLTRPVDKSRLWHRRQGEQWRLVEQMNIMLDEFLEGKVWDAGAFMLETQKPTGEWPRDAAVQATETASASGVTGCETELLQRHFEVGDRLEAQSGVTGHWMRGTIVDVIQRDHCSAPSQVKVHYDSTVYKCDEWISTASDRLAPLDTHTKEGGGSTSSSKPIVRGATGLQNLGNTCFMNATLQCMVNTPLVREYFLSSQYTKDVNVDRGIGCRGRLAEEFGHLVGGLWAGKETHMTPQSLKRTIDQFAPQFAGYEQHDAQELLAFFLDGLHEDLNRSAPIPGNSGRSASTRREAGTPKLFSSAKAVRPGGGSCGRSASRDVSPKTRGDRSAKAAWRDREPNVLPPVQTYKADHANLGPLVVDVPPAGATLHGGNAAELLSAADTASGRPIPTEVDGAADTSFSALNGKPPLLPRDSRESTFTEADIVVPPDGLAPDDEAKRSADGGRFRFGQPPMLWSRQRNGNDEEVSSQSSVPAHAAVPGWPVVLTTVPGMQPSAGGGGPDLLAERVPRQPQASLQPQPWGSEAVLQSKVGASPGGVAPSVQPGSAHTSPTGGVSNASEEDQASSTTNGTSGVEKGAIAAGGGGSQAELPRRAGSADAGRRATGASEKRPGTSRWWNFAWQRGRGALDLPKEVPSEPLPTQDVAAAAAAAEAAGSLGSFGTCSGTASTISPSGIVAVATSEPATLPTMPVCAAAAEARPDGSKSSLGLGGVFEESASAVPMLGEVIAHDVPDMTSERDAAQLEKGSSFEEGASPSVELLRPPNKPPAGSAGAAVAAAAANRATEISEDGSNPVGTYNESEDFIPEHLTPERPTATKRSLNLFNISWRRRRIDDEGGPLHSPKRRPRTPVAMTPLREEPGHEPASSSTAPAPGGSLGSSGSLSAADGHSGAPDFSDTGAHGSTGGDSTPAPTPASAPATVVSAPTRSFLPYWKAKRPSGMSVERRRDGSRESGDEAGDQSARAADSNAASSQYPDRARSREGRTKERAWPSFLRRSKSRESNNRPRQAGARPPPPRHRGDLPIMTSTDADLAAQGLSPEGVAAISEGNGGANSALPPVAAHLPRAGSDDGGSRDPTPLGERPSRGSGGLVGFPFLRAPWKSRGAETARGVSPGKPILQSGGSSSAQHSPMAPPASAAVPVAPAPPSAVDEGARLGEIRGSALLEAGSATQEVAHGDSLTQGSPTRETSGAGLETVDDDRGASKGDVSEGARGELVGDLPPSSLTCLPPLQQPGGTTASALSTEVMSGEDKEAEASELEDNSQDDKEPSEVDEDNLPDEEKAAHQWERYRARNRSLIVDVFEGQLRSQLTCRKCGASSSTFEPFRYLSVPIPSNHVDRATLRVVFFPLPHARGEERPQLRRFSVTVPKSATVQRVERALSRLLPVPMTSVLLAEVYRSRIHRYLDSNLPLSDVRAEDQLFAFEILQSPSDLIQYQERYAPSRQRRENKVEDPQSEPQPRVLLIQAMHRRVVDVCRSDGRTWAQRREVFGLPFVMAAASSWTYATLHDMLMLHARRFLRTPRRRDNGLGSGVATAFEPGIGQPEDLRPPTQMPFVARIVNASGAACGACDRRNCTGCLLPKGSARLRLRAGLLTGAVSTAKIYLALDWVDSVVYDQEYVDSVVDDPSMTKAAEGAADEHDAQDGAHMGSESSMHGPEGMGRVPSGDTTAEQSESRQGSSGRVPISACIDAFAQPEDLKIEHGNGIKCEKCNEVVDAVKRLEIWREPDVLILHIKRFHFSGVHYEKLNTPVEVCVRDLSLRPWIVGPSSQNAAPYELYAVACHFGGMSGGHYTSYAMNHEGKEPVWLKFNDESVTSVSVNQEVEDISRQCYVLFYRKRAFSSSNLINYSALL
eukprot:TRINITY_DN59371_c0_g1_i1.p1 TRINITY_DN59371_c0_g1~~TRINITY_DN59371_c0_g1_i1.p1  ORF type:complete len:2293 (+),score=533.78 TRINITY_DN59371_c0_g1_i1:227-7105(+)